MNHEVSYWDKNGMISSLSVSKKEGWQLGEAEAWHPSLKLGFAWQRSSTQDLTELRILHRSFREEGENRFKSIIPDLGCAGAAEGSGTSLILPFEQGMLCHCSGKPEGEMSLPLYATWPSHCNMSLYGLCGNGHALALIMEEGKFDADFRIRANFGTEHHYSIAARFWCRDFPDDAITDEDMVIFGKELNGSWPEVAKFYRDYIRARRAIPTLSQKMKNSPTLQYSAQALTVRMRLCVKQLPTPVLEQTPETQPPMTVFLSLDMAENIIREFRRQQVGPCEFNLVGWNYGGHDGAFPQLFPVEERIGGEAGLNRLLAAAQECGYPLSLHDNYFDSYTLADAFREDYVNRNRDQSLTRGGRYGGGQAYQTCPRCAWEKYVPANFEKMRRLGISGVYFSDVISIAQLTRCYSPQHPLNRRGNAMFWKKIMQAEHDIFGGSMSEGAREWALPELDRAYLVGLCMDRSLPYFGEENHTPFPYFDQEIPLFQMVYHGSLIYNSFRDGINSFPGDDIYLRNIAYGGVPLYYYHHLFNPDWNNGVGWSVDLRYTTGEKLTADIARIKRASEDLAAIAPLQTCFMEDFIGHSPTLSETRYSNGSSIWVNYADLPARSNSGHEIQPHNFMVVSN